MPGVTLYYAGGVWHDANNYEPKQIPTNEDYVTTDPNTQDIYCLAVPFCKGIYLAQFKGDIYYNFPDNQQSGCFRNHELDQLFGFRTDIKRMS